MILLIPIERFREDGFEIYFFEVIIFQAVVKLVKVAGRIIC